MQITSHAFLLVFLPLVLLGYLKFVKRPRARLLFLLVVSYVFYALAGWKFIFVLFGLSLATYVLALRRWYGAGLALNLIALVLFKYWNFGVENFIGLLRLVSLELGAPLVQLALPLGISFFVFKHIGYLLDVRSGIYEAATDFWLFATFSAYFPQISAGPISSYRDTGAQLAALPKDFSDARAYTALVYISMGLAKKVLIADQLVLFVGPQLQDVQTVAGLLPAWHLVIAYTMRLYFDFSGYTDMALGISALFGVALPANFNNPFLARDIGEFWERWHMSLSGWFRQYLYFPLSRWLLMKWGLPAAPSAQFVANIATMTLIGLWHGAGWGFVLWGLYNGILLNLNAWLKRRRRSLPPVAGWFLLMVAILFGMALFLSPDLSSAVHLLSQMSGLGGLQSGAAGQLLAQDPSTPVLFAAILLALSGFAEAAAVLHNADRHRVIHAILFGLLAALSLLLLQPNIEFVYAQF
jgi:alginate O-acetyltransferase complex protein AlgI